MVSFAFSFVLLTVPYASASFTDIPSDHPQVIQIEWAQSHRIVRGYPDGSFGPAKQINRAEFTKIVVLSSLGYPQDATSFALPFSDTTEGAWYVPYLSRAHEEAIILGYPDGTFRPSDSVNAAEAATILVRAWEVYVPEYPEGTAWYKPYVDVMISINGWPDTIKSFDQKITRNEMIQMIHELGITSAALSAPEP